MGVRLLFEDYEIDWQRLRGPPVCEVVTNSGIGEGRNISLASFSSEHLRSVSPLLALFEEAVGRGLIPNSEHAQIGFLATAQSCLRRARNPAGLFRWLIEAGLFNEASLEDEDTAVASFKRYLRGRTPSILKSKSSPANESERSACSSKMPR